MCTMKERQKSSHLLEPLTFLFAEANSRSRFRFIRAAERFVVVLLVVAANCSHVLSASAVVDVQLDGEDDGSSNIKSHSTKKTSEITNFQCTSYKDEGGESMLRCIFSLPRTEQTVTLEHCEDGDTFCVQANLHAQVKHTTAMETRQSIDTATETGVNDDSASQATATEEPPASSKLAVERILVGTNHFYDRPFSQYGSKIEKVLKKYNKKWRTVFDEADWYTQLGLAHRSIVEDDTLTKHSLAMEADDPEGKSQNHHHVLQAVAAFQQAAHLYQGIRHDFADEMDGLLASQLLASMYFHIGESYSLATNPELTDWALEYIVQAEGMYRSILMEREDPEKAKKWEWNEVEEMNAKINWAHCLLRLGSLLVSSALTSESLLRENLDMEKLSASLIDEIGLESLSQGDAMKGLKKTIASLVGDDVNLGKAKEKVAQAKNHFQQAAAIFREALQLEGQYHGQELIQMKRDLATALQNMATVNGMDGNLIDAVENSESALELYREVVDGMPGRPMETQDTRAAIAELLVALADKYLQLSKYDEAKDSYQQAMEWYEKHSIVPRDVDSIDKNMGLEETIKIYEDALEQYSDLLSGNFDLSEFPEDIQIIEDEFGQPIFQADEGYEGDLHAALGATYMSVGDALQASSHLIQAIELYERSGEGEEQTMATAKLNLSMAHFRNSFFMESAKLYNEAVEIFRVTVGEGENPLLYAKSALDHLELLNLGVDEDEDEPADSSRASSATKRQVTTIPKIIDQRGQTTGSESKHQGAKIRKEDGVTQSTQRAIDLDDFRHALENRTDDTDKARKVEENSNPRKGEL